MLRLTSLCCLWMFCAHSVAYAGTLARGVGRIVYSLFEIPRSVVAHSQQVVFPFGIVTGTVDGAVRMVGGTLAGTVETAAGAAPYAKYLIFFI